MIEASDAFSDRDLLDACDVFAGGLQRYFTDLDDKGRDEIAYYAAAAISVAAELGKRGGAGMLFDESLGGDLPTPLSEIRSTAHR